MITGENFDNCGKEHPTASIPPVVVADVRVDVPLAVVDVPVHVHDAGALSYPRSSITPPLDPLTGGF